jgi:DNA-binding MarR family transcriptional regulator
MYMHLAGHKNNSLYLWKSSFRSTPGAKALSPSGQASEEAYTLIYMASGPRQQQSKKTSGVIPLPCACANLRRATRLVTQLYEDALRPAGITGPQFTLLQALKLAPRISQKQLGKILGTDSTTLTRTLALMSKRGWLDSQPAQDRRALRLALNKSGEREYERALPYWQSAQKRLKQALGEANWKGLIEAVVNTAEAVR